MDGEFLVSSARERSSVPQARARKTAAVAKDEDEQIADLEQELAELKFEEERRGKQKRIALLQQQIEDKRTRLAKTIFLNKLLVIFLNLPVPRTLRSFALFSGPMH